MKAKDFEAIAYQIVTALVADACQPVRTAEGNSFQFFTPLSIEENKILRGCNVSCHISDNGHVGVTIAIYPSREEDTKMLEVYKRLKAKNYCLLAVEAKQDSQRKAEEADELLTKAASQLGIPVEDVEKIVVTEKEG